MRRSNKYSLTIDLKFATSFMNGGLRLQRGLTTKNFKGKSKMVMSTADNKPDISLDVATRNNSKPYPLLQGLDNVLQLPRSNPMFNQVPNHTTTTSNLSS